MHKLIFHCGAYKYAPKKAEILGSLTLTAAEMSDIGKSLTPGDGPEDRHVFSNSSDLCNGVRIAIRNGNLDSQRFAFAFHDPCGNEHTISVGDLGDLCDMVPGFFDQAEKDLIQLF